MKKCFAGSPLVGSLPVLLIVLAQLLVVFADLQAQFTLNREPVGPSSRRTGLVITEIMYNPLPVPGLSTNETMEFVELYNSKPWPENIGGFSITGDVHFVFPPNTMLGPEEYLVVARVPDLISTNFSITNVFGPWEGAETNRLSPERGLVQLLNRVGAVLLSVDYRDSPPWPEGADGTGHSLNLARPSYGEADSRAWAQSDSMGGSPGGPDPVTLDPLASVLINEWQNHSDPVDWLELYNHSNEALDLSGAYLSDAPSSNFYRIPDGTFIAARGFRSWDQNQLGFELFAGGESVFFWSKDRMRVIDVIDFRGQSNNVSTGRSPDGGPFMYTMTERTQGGPNSERVRYDVVINEIMYNPASGNAAEEYIEIHNQSARSANISGWEFVVGISYTFPTNQLTLNMPAGAYWVVAADPEALMEIHPHLTTNNTFGPYDGALANGGERVVFTAADYDIVSGIVEKLTIPVSDVTYSDGGAWGAWSDGGGSSLELIDPQGDQNHPSNWADSDESAETEWTAIEMTVPLGESLGQPINDRLIVALLGIGEFLLDDVEVRVDNGPNLMVNGGFEAGLEGWSLQGSFDQSTLEDSGFSGNKSLHVRAGSRGENQSNRILSAPFTAPIPATAKLVSLRAKAKWLHGFPDLLLRLHGSATEAYGTMARSPVLGTPGMPNSRRVNNAGPAVYDVSHRPVLPAVNEPVLVTARATDIQSISSLKLRFRIDPSPDYIDVPMVDDGFFGDAIANDGLFTALLPGQPAGTIVPFYVEAQDGQGAVGTFPVRVFPEPGLARLWPTDAVRRECLVRWGETQMPGDFATYHLWVSSINSNRWHHRDAMNNNEMDGTFVYNDSRVVYNALPLFSGSPWHRTNSISGPAGTNRVDYEMNFPDDDPFLGATDFVLNNSGNPDRLTISDLSGVAEQTVYRIFDGLGLPHNHRRYIHFFVNGNQRSTAYERAGNFIFEDSQQPNGDMIDQWFPNDAGGQLFKVEDWFEFDSNGFDFTAYNDADLERRTIELDGEPTFVPAPYRFMFRKRSIGASGSASDFQAVYDLIDAVSPEDDPDSRNIDQDRLGDVIDWEAWMQHFAIQRTVGNFDSFGWERGKNDYLYTTAGGFVHMPWDIDYSLGLGRPALDDNLFESSDSRVVAMFNTPLIVRAYWRAFDELVNGPFRNEVLDPFIDERVEALLANDINIDLSAVAGIKTYITERRAFLMSKLEEVATTFAIDGPAAYETTNNLVTLTGTAPVIAKDILLNDGIYPIVWTSVNTFMLRFVLEPGVNEIILQGLDRFGQPLAEAVAQVDIDYTGPVIDPAGALIISELMHAPAVPGGQFVEIMNLTSVNFGLSGWRIDGLGLVFPPGTILDSGETVVVAQNRELFQDLYGPLSVLAEFPGSLDSEGEIISLIKPLENGDSLVDAVRFETVPPWVTPPPGFSLQLIDAAQGNGRAANWTFDPVVAATPGTTNSVAAPLPLFDPLWLNEIQSENVFGPTMDNMGELEPWLELHNSGETAVLLDGYFLAQSYESNLTQWPFPVGATIEPGEYKLIWLDGEPGESTVSDWHTDFRADYDGSLALTRFDGSEPWILDYLNWETPGVNASQGDFPDGQQVFRVYLYEPTPGAANMQPPIPVYINEWMARNDSTVRDPVDMEYDDWFELYNGGETTIDLGGLYLTDDETEPDKFMIPDTGQYRIPPHGFLMVWADDEPEQNLEDIPDLHLNFRLGGSAGIIALYQGDAMTLVDRIAYGEQTVDRTEGRYTDGAGVIYMTANPTPGRRNNHPDVNTPPQFGDIPNVVMLAGEQVTFSTFPSDPDWPAQFLSYQFEPALPGVQMNPAGLFRWTAPEDQPPGDYRFTITVTDSGTPPRYDRAHFTISIVEPGVIPDVGIPSPIVETLVNHGGLATFTFTTVPGLTYRVLYKDDLNALNWFPLEKDFVAANETGSITDYGINRQRYYQILVVEEEDE